MGYQELGAAVVKQAVKDYRTAHRRLRRRPEDAAAEKTIEEIEAFFEGPYFEMFTDLDGPWMLKRLKTMMEEHNEI